MVHAGEYRETLSHTAGSDGNFRVNPEVVDLQPTLRGLWRVTRRRGEEPAESVSTSL
jgi:hypothetical protein